MSATQFLNRRQAADLMGISPKTLSNWTSRRIGPAVYNPTGGRALYDQEEVIAFVRGVAVEPPPPKRGRGRPPKQPR